MTDRMPARAVDETAVAPQGVGKAGSPGITLTLSCPDTTGIVAAVSQFLASRQCSITEVQHYDDPAAVTFQVAYGVTGFMEKEFR